MQAMRKVLRKCCNDEGRFFFILMRFNSYKFMTSASPMAVERCSDSYDRVISFKVNDY